MVLSTKEIIQAGTALQKNLDNSNFEPALDILRQLRDELQATDEILKTTKIGLAVGKLRKYPNKKVADLANEIVRKWKQEIDAAKTRNGGSRAAGKADKSNVSTPGGNATQGGSGAATPLATAATDAATGSGSSPAPAIKPKEVRTTVTDKVDVDRASREPVRNNCIKLIYNSLAIDADPGKYPSSLLLEKAESIESTIGRRFDGKLEGPYKQKMRSLYLNLKGINISLRSDLRNGTLTTDALCAMTPEEMASDERKAQNKRLEEEGIFAAMAAVASKASTDMFRCGKCGKRETTYYQMQTRSADEPMTTFITCVNCGHRFKM